MIDESKNVVDVVQAMIDSIRISMISKGVCGVCLNYTMFLKRVPFVDGVGRTKRLCVICRAKYSEKIREDMEVV